MPKPAQYRLSWQPDLQQYQLSGPELVAVDPAHDLPAWLAQCQSFAFDGQSGHISLLKERRKGGDGYWYAYRRHGARTHKRYVGHGAGLTIARLEDVARLLAAPPLDDARVPQAAPDLRLTGPAQLRLETRWPSPPLLMPKLQLPRLPAALLGRERLLRLLDAGRDRRLTLVCAPAGFGKTTLLRQWVDAQARADSGAAPLRTAWVALDTGDNDPLRFWRYCIAACRSLHPELGQSTLALLQAGAQIPFEPLQIEYALTIFLNDLSQRAVSGLLVLEDYHTITTPAIHASLSYVIEHLPEHLRLVILTRSTPPLPIARLRALGALCEITSAELRFSPDETLAFLAQLLTVPIGPDLAQKIAVRSEGWAAGLRLLALALEGRSPAQTAERMIELFVGSHQPFFEYFVAEVLGAQPEPIQQFLLRTSMLNRFTASLCDAVIGQDDGAKLLGELLAGNLFIEQLDDDGSWYRYHALFAEAMRHAARRRLGDAALHELCLRASRWYEQHSLYADAVETALLAQDWAYVASLIERLIVRIEVQEGGQIQEFHTLLRWLRQLPDAQIERRPLLCLYYAIALLFSTIVERLPSDVEIVAERYITIAERGLRAENNLLMLGKVMAYRAFLCKYRGDLADAQVYAQRSLDWLPQHDLAWRALSLSVLGTYAVFVGQYQQARQLFWEAQRLSEFYGKSSFVRAHQGMRTAIDFEQGRLHQAAASYRALLSEAREEDDQSDICHALLGLARLAYEWNDLATAAEYAQDVAKLADLPTNEIFLVYAMIVLARVQRANGQPALALQQLTQLQAQLNPYSTQRAYQFYRELQDTQAWLCLALGDLPAVQRWAAACQAASTDLPIDVRQHEDLLQAQLYLALEQPQAALDLLLPQLNLARAAEQSYVALGQQALIALAYAALEHMPDALAHLGAALAEAQHEGFVRLFADLGAPMAALLAAYAPHAQQRAYVERLRRAFADAGITAPQPQPALPHGPLSPQELRVLRLLAAGRSNPAIARELVVSVNTVRTQVQSIFRKLDVSNRVAASDAARRLQLL